MLGYVHLEHNAIFLIFTVTTVTSVTSANFDADLLFSI